MTFCLFVFESYGTPTHISKNIKKELFEMKRNAVCHVITFVEKNAAKKLSKLSSLPAAPNSCLQKMDGNFRSSYDYNSLFIMFNATVRTFYNKKYVKTIAMTYFVKNNL